VIAQSGLQFGLGRIAEVFSEFISLPFEFRLFKQREKVIACLQDDSKDQVED